MRGKKRAGRERFGFARRQRLVKGFREKRSEGRQNFGQFKQNETQNGRGLFPIPFLPRLLEPPAGAADVPAGKVVNEAVYLAARFSYFIPVQPVARRFKQLVAARQNPAVQNVAGFGGQRNIRFVRSVGLVKNERVIQNKNEFPHRLRQIPLVKPFRLARRVDGVKIPANGVGAVFLEHFPRVNDVSLGFGHFFAVFIQNVADGNDVAIRRRPASQNADRQKSVKPAARLIYRLANEIGRKHRRHAFRRRVNHLFVFKRIMERGERHRAGIKPDVGDVFHSRHFGAAFRAPQKNAVQMRPVAVNFRVAVIRPIIQGYFARFPRGEIGNFHRFLVAHVSRRRFQHPKRVAVADQQNSRSGVPAVKVQKKREDSFFDVGQIFSAGRRFGEFFQRLGEKRLMLRRRPAVENSAVNFPQPFVRQILYFKLPRQNFGRFRRPKVGRAENQADFLFFQLGGGFDNRFFSFRRQFGNFSPPFRTGGDPIFNVGGRFPVAHYEKAVFGPASPVEIFQLPD